MPKHIAILDLGSNSARVSIFKVENGKTSFLTRKKETCRLSLGMAKDGFLTKESMERTCQSILSLCKIVKQYECDTILTAATAAVRNAKNKDEFLILIKNQTNLDLRVLSGEEEAQMGFWGVKSSFSLSQFVLIDTGGGSSEISIIKDNKILSSISLPIGAIVMTDQFLERDIVSAKSLFKLSCHILSEIKKCENLNVAQNFPIIVLGGPNKTIAKVMKKSRNIHGFTLSRNEIFSFYETLLEKNLLEREKLLGEEKDRADVIIAGLTPLVLLMQLINSMEVTACDHGLEYGLLYQYRKENNLLPSEETLF